jgi:hypothetical protein
LPELIAVVESPAEQLIATRNCTICVPNSAREIQTNRDGSYVRIHESRCGVVVHFHRSFREIVRSITELTLPVVAPAIDRSALDGTRRESTGGDHGHSSICKASRNRSFIRKALE